MTDQAAAPAGGAPAPEAGSPASGAPAAAPEGTPTPWYQSEGFSEETSAFAADRGWEGPAAVVESYRNLEKLTGAPPESILKLPGADATPEEQMAIWDRLGRPQDPSGYELPAGEGVDEGFQAWAKETFHKIGLPKEMASALSAAYDQYAAERGTADQETRADEFKAQETQLKKDWGAAHEQNTAKARQAAQGLGIDGDTIDQLEKSMGFAKTMQLFHSIGEKMGEGTFHTGGAESGFGVMTPAAAQGRIAALRKDEGFIARYTKGDLAAKEEMAKLHRWAYPDEN
jgi:hypothetical protein